jgi:outer membrane protein TolC
MRRKHADTRIGGLAAFVLICVPWVAAAARPSDANGQGPLEIRMGQAVLMALTNNRALSVQRLNPEIQQTFEQVERAAFDPVVAAEGAFERAHASTNGSLEDMTEIVTGSLGVTQYLPTGTRLGATMTTERDSIGRPESTSSAGLALTQALLQGRPVAVNLASLRQARLNTDISAYELRGFAEALVAAVESAYWECTLAHRRVEILGKSLTLAEQQLNEVEQRIRVGSLPETELAAAQAEVALRREALINARSGLSTARLLLLRLIAPDALRGPRVELLLMTDPAVPEVNLGTIDSHVAVALQNRPDMNQARMKVQNGDLELVKTRNGLLPKMDLFIRLGDTGYAESFGESVNELDGKDPEVAAGVSVEFPIRNREARAIHQHALFSREQMGESLKNLEDLVCVDVESAYIEVERTREQVVATATTRRFQEEKLRAETVKFKVGRSTALLVGQTQRDLVLSQLAEVLVVVRHLEALVDLFRLEGSLLERRGVSAPGRQPTLTPQSPAPAVR